jgi:hypothetical protein
MEASDAPASFAFGNEGILMAFHFISVYFENNKALADLATKLCREIHHRLRPYQPSCTLNPLTLGQTLVGQI